jgi:predicted transcriptional regulator of viral defense system
MGNLEVPRPQIASPLARLATRQHGVVARRQLDPLAVTAGMTRTLIARGHLIRIHRAVYAVGHARLSTLGRWMAAVLACGDGALLSHADALALHGCGRIPTGAVHVTARSSHRVPGVRCHVAREHSSLGPTVRDGIPVTSLERAVLDCAPQLTPARLAGVLESVERRDRFDLRRFEVVLARANGHRGVGRLRAALADLGDDPPALRSALEARMLELIRAADLPVPTAASTPRRRR